jgi:hypothetical protein
LGSKKAHRPWSVHRCVSAGGKPYSQIRRCWCIYTVLFWGRKSMILFPLFVVFPFPTVYFYYGCPFSGIYPSPISMLWLCPFILGLCSVIMVVLWPLFYVFMFVFLMFLMSIVTLLFLFLSWWTAFLVICLFLFMFSGKFFCYSVPSFLFYVCFYFMFLVSFYCFVLFIFFEMMDHFFRFMFVFVLCFWWVLLFCSFIFWADGPLF